MKIFNRILEILVLIVVSATVIVGGCFVGVFATSRSKPQEIFLFNYAFVAQKGDDGKVDMWFVQKAGCDSLDNGDGVVYYDGAYRGANAMTSGDTVTFYSSDDMAQNAEVDDENIVGKVIALWQQK